MTKFSSVLLVTLAMAFVVPSGLAESLDGYRWELVATAPPEVQAARGGEVWILDMETKEIRAIQGDLTIIGTTGVSGPVGLWTHVVPVVVEGGDGFVAISGEGVELIGSLTTIADACGGTPFGGPTAYHASLEGTITTPYENNGVEWEVQGVVGRGLSAACTD